MNGLLHGVVHGRWMNEWISGQAEGLMTISTYKHKWWTVVWFLFFKGINEGEEGEWVHNWWMAVNRMQLYRLKAGWWKDRQTNEQMEMSKWIQPCARRWKLFYHTQPTSQIKALSAHPSHFLLPFHWLPAAERNCLSSLFWFACLWGANLWLNQLSIKASFT